VTAPDPTGPLAVNVASLLGEPSGSARDYVFDEVLLDLDRAGRIADAVDEVPLADPPVLAAPVRARFHLARTNRGLIVDGDVATALAETCSRCLRPIVVPLEAEIHEEALPSVELATGAPVDTSAEPEVARLTDHHEIDLEPFVREAILLAAPIAPLCRPDCPGLCAVCGLELGSGPHDHPEEAIDPRLEALRAFRVDEDDETA
jgi:uncharacterized protein